MSGKPSPNATVSTYYADMHLLICVTADTLNEIYVDNQLAWSGSVSDETSGYTGEVAQSITFTKGQITGTEKGVSGLYINSPNMFGGLSREGGIRGWCDFARGLETQEPNAHLSSFLGNIPAYRQVVSLFLYDMYFGLNYYLKPWTANITRIFTLDKGVTQWYPEVAEPTSGLINAVHVLRECLTDPCWGMGLSGDKINDASWRAAALLCYNEGLAFGFIWDRTTDLNEFMDNVGKHIQCNYYLNRQTGLWEINAVRRITDTSDLFIADASVVKSVKSLAKKTLNKLVNQVTVTFTNNLNNQTANYRVSNPSLLSRQGRFIPQSTTYDGVTNYAMAQKLALRDLTQLGQPIFTGSIEVSQEMLNFNQGDAFILRVPDKVNRDLIVRVMAINLGSSSSRQITMDIAEDFFEAANISYADNPFTKWVPVVTVPVDATYRFLYEVPYYAIALQKGDVFASAVDPVKTFCAGAVVSPSGDSISANLWTGLDDVNFTRRNAIDFCPTALLVADITKETVTFSITAALETQLLTIGNYILIDAECMQIVSISGVALTVNRGVLDTVPELHYASARLYGIGDTGQSDWVTYFTSQEVFGRFTTKTPKGELAINDATSVNVTLVGRMHLPYPPANLKFFGYNSVAYDSVFDAFIVVDNGEYWPLSHPAGKLRLTWAHRNRLLQTNGLTSWYASDISVEPSITYSGELTADPGTGIVTLASFAGVTDNFITLDTGTPVTASVTYVSSSGSTGFIYFDADPGFSIGDTISVSGITGTVANIPLYFNGTFTVLGTGATAIDLFLVSHSNGVSFTMLGSPDVAQNTTLPYTWVYWDSHGASISVLQIPFLGATTLTMRSTNPNGNSMQEVQHTFDLTLSVG